jgi:Flp pilus assembly protein TadG
MSLFRNQSGQSTILLAVFLGIISIGFLALAVDVGYFFHAKRMAQAAADAAAVAAAEEQMAGSSGNEQTVANAMARLNGFDPAAATNPATVTLSIPSSGNYSGSTNYIEADVSKPVPGIFLNAFKGGATTFTVGARAVAGGGLSSPTCICLESPTGAGLSMSNNAQISAPQCGVTVDSSGTNAVGVTGSANLSALSLGTVSSTWDNSGNINNNGTIASTTKVVQGITNQCKPTLTVPTLPNGITCYNNPIQGWILPGYTANYTLPIQGVKETNGTTVNEAATNGVICYNSLDTSQASSVTFSPGYTYYIVGNFTTGGGAPLTGNGVTFYVGGTVNIANGVTVNLSAPTVGSNPAVPQTLLYAMGNSVTIQGGSNSTLSGLVYAPNAAVTLNNGTGTTLNMDFVSQSLSMSGGAVLNSYATTNLGTLNLSVAKLAE